MRSLQPQSFAAASAPPSLPVDVEHPTKNTTTNAFTRTNIAAEMQKPASRSRGLLLIARSSKLEARSYLISYASIAFPVNNGTRIRCLFVSRPMSAGLFTFGIATVNVPPGLPL